MAGQLWGASDQGQLLYSPLMSKEVTMQMQPKLRFAQFCEMKSEWGKNAGETFVFPKYSDIDTQGGTLTETATIPLHKYTVTRGTCTLNEYGNAIPFTKKYSTLSQIEVRSGINEILSDDAAKVIDTAVENEFDACKIRYVAETTNTYTVTTNGTATKTCTAHFNQWHLKTMVDYMYQTLRCDPYDGENYMGIMTTDAMRYLYDDLESVMQYTKFPATGEVGRYYDTRFVKTNHAMSNAMGASSAYGEMYLIGKRDPVMRGVAQKLTIIPKEETDFQRSRGLAWYCIEGYRLIYSHDPSSNVMKFCSA